MCPEHSESSSSPVYKPLGYFTPASPLRRAAIATPITFLRTVRMRSRTLVFNPPAAAAISFTSRVNTRDPSPSRLLSVG